MMQKLNSYLQGDETQFILEPNTSEQRLWMQIQVTPNSMFQYGNSLIKIV